MGEVTGARAGREDDRLLAWPAVQAVTGISRTTAWRMQKTGDFPLPVVVSPGRVSWWESELTAWKTARAPRSAGPSLFGGVSAAPRGRPRSAVRETISPNRTVDVVADEVRNTSATGRRNSKVAPGQIAFDFG